MKLMNHLLIGLSQLFNQILHIACRPLKSYLNTFAGYLQRVFKENNKLACEKNG